MLLLSLSPDDTDQGFMYCWKTESERDDPLSYIQNIQSHGMYPIMKRKGIQGFVRQFERLIALFGDDVEVSVEKPGPDNELVGATIGVI
jgi:hypothetical protein